MANWWPTSYATREIDVQLTRTDDRTLIAPAAGLAFADKVPADLFVSIHANASPTRIARGYETYVLVKGVDVDARALRSDTTTPRKGVPEGHRLCSTTSGRGAAQWESAELTMRECRTSSATGAATTADRHVQ